MKKGGIYLSELTTSRHTFRNYHFCRGNSNKRKTRLGVIERGKGAYIYLGKRLPVCEGDVVFIPENIFCYSEWHGEPEIAVTYVSCFMHYDGFCYEPQLIPRECDVKDGILQIAELLGSDDQLDELEAYSLFYRLLKRIIPEMAPSDLSIDKTLGEAIEFVTKNWDKSITVSEIARACCVSESTVHHIFKRDLGVTPIHFINSIRINVAIEYLENGSHSIATVSRLAGFNSENHFRRIFTELCGTTPLKFRKSK